MSWPGCVRATHYIIGVQKRDPGPCVCVCVCGHALFITFFISLVMGLSKPGELMHLQAQHTNKCTE